MKKQKKQIETEYHCLMCASDNLLVYEETSWLLNTGEFYCNSVKMFDSDAKVRCQECGWTGELKDVTREV